jgi:hypothetical protein
MQFVVFGAANGLRKSRMLSAGTGAGAGVDSVWEQEKQKTACQRWRTVQGKILEKLHRTPASSACFVRRVLPLCNAD